MQMPVQIPPVSNPEVRPPSQEPHAGESMQSQYTLSQVQDDQLGGILSHNELTLSESPLSQTHKVQLANVHTSPPQAYENRVHRLPSHEPREEEAMECDSLARRQKGILPSAPSQEPRHNESQHPQPEVMTGLSVTKTTPDATVDLQLQDSEPQHRQPGPHLARGTGQHGDSDEVFNLHQRIYQDADTSTTQLTATISPASSRLLATEGGHSGICHVDKETLLFPVSNPTEAPASAALLGAEEGHNDICSEDRDVLLGPSIGNPTGELAPSQARIPLAGALPPPHRSYEMPTSRNQQHRDLDEAFNLRWRIYQDADTSTTKLTATISPASGRLLATEGGHVSVLHIDKETLLLQVGNPPEAPASAALLVAEEGHNGIRFED
ncbi:hypothetical protein SCLCIDRAFT_10491 [Scleroderma citrinum Foug A]|uniref:Uncharacterized protein n=1 Tax=Scleroderma citrinum Foug A TaxID=1036808 RepID=A0A0C3D9B2_9AGAM|nr:hypothetical protein SCLCIDRAFT_10491 [Scleroderma citrinum Foug A]